MVSVDDKHRVYFISTQTFLRAPTAPVDSCAEIKSAPSAVYVTSSGPRPRVDEEGAGKRWLECD